MESTGENPCLWHQSKRNQISKAQLHIDRVIVIGLPNHFLYERVGSPYNPDNYVQLRKRPESKKIDELHRFNMYAKMGHILKENQHFFIPLRRFHGNSWLPLRFHSWHVVTGSHIT